MDVGRPTFSRSRRGGLDRRTRSVHAPGGNPEFGILHRSSSNPAMDVRSFGAGAGSQGALRDSKRGVPGKATLFAA